MILELYPPKRGRKHAETVSSEEVQLKWIDGLVEQIEFANDPDVLPDYFLHLKIAKRRLEP